MHATKKMNFRTIGLAAVVLAVALPPASADITLGGRNSDAAAFADALPESDHPETKIQTDFLPANLSNSATATFNGVTATANCTSISSINLDSANNSLNVTGHGTSSASSNDVKGYGQTVAQVIRLFFSLSDVSYTWSLTGQLSAGINANDYQQVQLVKESIPTEVLFSESAGQGFADLVNLSGSGALPPGTYRLQVDVVSQSFTRDGVPSNGIADFNFTVQWPGCGESHHLGPNGQDVVTIVQCGPIQWNNAAGGSFATKENWDPQTVPGATDTAVFALDATYSVDVGTATTDKLEVNGGTVTFTNSDYTVTGLGDEKFLVDNATLTLASGSLNCAQGVVGPNAAATVSLSSGASLFFAALDVYGVVEVHDSALLDVSSILRIGPTIAPNAVRSGVLTIGDVPPFGSGGGVVQTPECVVYAGILGIHGQGTTGARLDVAEDLSIGGLLSLIPLQTSSTSASITDGAVAVAQQFALGDYQGTSSATLTISGVGSNGQGSLLNVAGANPEFIVSGAPGTLLEVVDGGMLSTSSITSFIGSGLLIGKVLIHGKSGSLPSTWAMADDFLNIGSQVMPSELVVQEGGVVTGDNPAIFLGNGARELGWLTITGDESSFTTGLLRVGEGGDGVLTVSGGAHCDAGPCRVASPPAPARGTGLATIQGTLLESSEWHVSSITVGDNEPGTLRLEGQTILGVDVGGATLRADDTVTIGLKGFVRGNGTIVSPKVVGKQHISPDVDMETPVRGSAALVAAPPGKSGLLSTSAAGGIIKIEGDYEQTADGKLTIDTVGVAAGEFDVLHVTGNATLAGTLEMLFPGTYLPKAGDSFQFLMVDGTISGEFAEVTFPQLLPGFQFDTMQVPGGLLFTALNDAVLAPTFLLNISTRLQVGTDENVLIGGFILQGTEAKRVLIRAVGPSLAAVGLSGALANPTLELHDGTGALIGQNDDWRETQTGGLITDDQFFDIFATGIPPTSFEESAIIATLDPGAYTAIIAGADSSTGIGLVEVYDLGPAAVPTKLANISTRGFVQAGDNVMIGGFIVGNQTSQVLVRAIGPSLVAFGVSGALADPTLELHDGNGALLASNDNWRSDQEAEIEATSLPPNDDMESAILSALAPGAYTAILRGVSDSTGVGLVEAYNLD